MRRRRPGPRGKRNRLHVRCSNVQQAVAS
jgi:hypothetical protein